MLPLTPDTPTIAVIGATGGIGTALSRRLRERGFRLLLGARRSDRLDALAAEVGGTAHPLEARDFAAVEAFIGRAAESGGRLRGAVNLAGSILLKPAHRTSAAELEETLGQNLVSAFALVRAATAAMREGGGSIVLMSSAAAATGLANHEAIAAAKAGVEGLARAAAATYASSGIRVNAVAPGLVDTPLAARLVGNEASRKASEAMHPLGRIGRADEVAAAIAWLLSDDATWVTGQTIGIDGGLARVRGRG